MQPEVELKPSLMAHISNQNFANLLELIIVNYLYPMHDIQMAYTSSDLEVPDVSPPNVVLILGTP